MNIKSKGIILTLLVIGTLITTFAITQADAYANVTASQEQTRYEHQYRNRLTGQEGICQNMGDTNELNEDCENLEWQHQIQMRNSKQTCPQTKLRKGKPR
ncbi:MAG: hypothetical protein V3S97_07485 [Candidatus Bathyarchaeia archaeon]|jgi:hypothetical protein